MNFDELKERLRGDAQKFKERLEDNSTYVSLRDRFQSQTPIVQKTIIIGGLVVLTLVVGSVPYGKYSTSQDYLTEYQAKRNLIRDLFRVQKEISEAPEVPVPPTFEAIESRIEADLAASELLPDQKKGVRKLPPVKSAAIAEKLNSGVLEVELGQLNLQQVTELGFQMQSISPSVKLKDLVLTANPQTPGYFDVIYRLLVLNVSEKVQAEEESAPRPTKGRDRKPPSESKKSGGR